MAECRRRDWLALDLPGHGASDTAPDYDLPAVAALIHQALEGAGLSEPVMVGHSLAAVLVTFYATIFPVSGVVNVDQSLRTEGFTQMVAPMAARLRSPDFATMWPMFRGSMHTELLSHEAQDLLDASSTPTQELVTGYWKDVLDRPADELTAYTDQMCAALRQKAVPYLSVMGAEPEAGYADWLADAIPQARMEILPGSGHFPHLKHPERFARILADTAHAASRAGSPS
ncbi:alpha/beta fold hydrolase [Pseudarthrobacter sp. N5]|uniref:alpha/beta fold hydrolase n=1 Tax=Pseudarthrobacter sp. N5 TaxID=3418416 RepID=UPI003CF8823E